MGEINPNHRYTVTKLIPERESVPEGISMTHRIEVVTTSDDKDVAMRVALDVCVHEGLMTRVSDSVRRKSQDIGCV